MNETREETTRITKVSSFTFVKRSQGNYFCRDCFDRVLQAFATHAFLSVYISGNLHYCDACGIRDVAKYRIRF